MARLYKVKEGKTLWWAAALLGWPEELNARPAGALKWRERHLVAFAGPGDVVDLDRRVDFLNAADQMAKLQPVDKGKPVELEDEDLAREIEADPMAVLARRGLNRVPNRRSHDSMGYWMRKRGLTDEDLEPRSVKPAEPKRGPGRPKKVPKAEASE